MARELASFLYISMVEGEVAGDVARIIPQRPSPEKWAGATHGTINNYLTKTRRGQSTKHARHSIGENSRHPSARTPNG